MHTTLQEGPGGIPILQKKAERPFITTSQLARALPSSGLPPPFPGGVAASAAEILGTSSCWLSWGAEECFAKAVYLNSKRGCLSFKLFSLTPTYGCR